MQHRDPSVPTADVWVDGERVGEVDAGDALRLRVERGAHRISVTRPGHADNAWSSAGHPWIYIVDERLHITLTTPTFRQNTTTSDRATSDASPNATTPRPQESP